MRLGTSTQLHSPTKKMSSLKERAGFHRGTTWYRRLLFVSSLNTGKLTNSNNLCGYIE